MDPFAMSQAIKEDFQHEQEQMQSSEQKNS